MVNGISVRILSDVFPTPGASYPHPGALMVFDAYVYIRRTPFVRMAGGPRFIPHVRSLARSYPQGANIPREVLREVSSRLGEKAPRV